jgi:hypothetical protein
MGFSLIDWSSGSCCCAAAISDEEIVRGAKEEIRDNASAAEFSSPGTYRMSVVYWLIRSSWRACRWLVVDSSLFIAKVSGLWSV